MIEIKNVVKKFDSNIALDGLNIHVKDSSIYGLVGINGAGKTTIIKEIMGIQRPDEGEIIISGQPVYENVDIKAKLGYVSDDIYFPHGYALRDMMRYYREIYKDFDEVRFCAMVNDFGLDAARKLSAFSKGMQKQVAIIMALSVKPDCLVLDEPIDGLDPVMRLKAWKYIIDDVAERGTSVLISSHNLREMEGYCDHIGIIADGKMVIEREIDDLKTDVHKVQLAFKEKRNIDYGQLNVLHAESRGSVDMLIIKNRREDVERIIEEMDPAIFDMLPLSLEEIFIYELGGENSEVAKLV